MIVCKKKPPAGGYCLKHSEAKVLKLLLQQTLGRPYAAIAKRTAAGMPINFS